MTPEAALKASPAGSAGLTVQDVGVPPPTEGVLGLIATPFQYAAGLVGYVNPEGALGLTVIVIDFEVEPAEFEAVIA